MVVFFLFLDWHNRLIANVSVANKNILHVFQELEPRITEICSGLMTKLEENDKEIAALLARIKDDEVIIDLGAEESVFKYALK